MRLDSEQAQAIKDVVAQSDAGAEVFLFGSRVRDEGRGGDIDLLIMSSKIDLDERRRIKLRLIDRLGARDETYEALQQFADEYPIDFGRLRCRCEVCGGFGQGRFADEYRAGYAEIEAHHRREYPGIHKADHCSHKRASG